jgi:membrane protease YdiL (CAAX protease family)
MAYPEDFESKPTINPWALAGAGGAIWLLSSFIILAAFRSFLPPKEWMDIYGTAEKSVLAFSLLFFITSLGIKIPETLRSWWSDRAKHLRIVLRYFGVYAGSLALVMVALVAIFLLLEKMGQIDYSTIVRIAEEPDPADKASRLKILLDTSIPRFLLSLATTCVLAPLIEETFFRRFFFVALRKNMPFAPALLISTAGFMAVHSNVALGAIGGIYLGYVYEKGKSLPANILIHVLVNSTVTGITLAL